MKKRFYPSALQAGGVLSLSGKVGHGQWTGCSRWKLVNANKIIRNCATILNFQTIRGQIAF